MSLRTRLSVCFLEGRDNPSGPALIDPYSVAGTPPAIVAPPTDPIVVPATDPTSLAISAATATLTGVTSTTTDPSLGDLNSIYKVPLLP